MTIYYDRKLKAFSRYLRSNQTDAEALLWSRIRRKQIIDVPFYRQKPIGSYIVDFYAPSIKLVIEVDGGQHFEDAYRLRDNNRDDHLFRLGLAVLRFDNLQVLHSIDDVVGFVYVEVGRRLRRG